MTSTDAVVVAAWGRVIDGKAVTVSLERSPANDEPLFATQTTHRFKSIQLFELAELRSTLSAQEDEIKRLQGLVRDAYNEAFIEGAQEHTPKGGKPWSESCARAALALK